jgi:hypothetical protein
MSPNKNKSTAKSCLLSLSGETSLFCYKKTTNMDIFMTQQRDIWLKKEFGQTIPPQMITT